MSNQHEDEQGGGSIQNPAPIPFPKKRRSFFPVVVALVAILSLLLASFRLTYIPIMASAIIILLGLLQMQSVSNWVERVVESIYKHMDKRWQDLADRVEPHWKRHWGQRWMIAALLLFVTLGGFVLHDFVLPHLP